jgi:glucokinase
MTTRRDDPVAIGVDVGGTAIKAGLVGADGRVLASDSVATQVEGGVDHVIDRIAEAANRLRGAAPSFGRRLTAIGLGMPGTLDRRRGLVVASPNLDAWRNVPVVERLAERTGAAVVLENDANCAALGEFVAGAGRECHSMVMITLGTGVGGGIVLGDRLWHGAQENAGEIGHMIVQAGGRRCGCGQLGCLEAYASATATVARMAQLIRQGAASTLQGIVDRQEELTTEHVVQAVEAGDATARRVWEETCRYVAIGCLNLHHLLSPRRIVLAGGMSLAGDTLLDAIRRALDEIASPTMGAPKDIRLAMLGNDAGFIGAALVALTEGAG